MSFPTSPTINQRHNSYVWNGNSWNKISDENVRFYARNINHQSISSTPHAIIFDETVINYNNSYNNSNGVFTVPFDGEYHFDFVFLISNAPTSSGGHASIHINGALETYFTRYGSNSGVSYTGYDAYVPHHGSANYYLNKGDQVSIRALSYAGSNIYGSSSWSHFSGYLVN